MKKSFVIGLVIACLLAGSAQALEFKIFDMRNKIYLESQEIKALLPKSKDAVVIINMFDSCIISMTQMDAYFSMIGIFETIKADDARQQALDLLLAWLTEIKRANDLNIKSFLNVANQPVEKSTGVHIKKLVTMYTELNTRISEEINKVSSMKKTVKPRK